MDIPFCPDVKQVAFTVFGCDVGLGTVLWFGIVLTIWVCLSYRLATRYSDKRYKGVPE